MFKQTLSSEGQQLSISPRGSNISQAEREQPTKAMIRRRNLWFLFIVFTLAALVDVVIASRSELWPDEVFSLATATGHSLEQPAAFASPTLGDFVEPDHPVPAKEFRHYVKHDDPPASPARVIRAVLLSDTNPPLYYLLLYGWTFIFGTSDIVLRVFSVVCSLACLPLLAGVARRTGGRGAVFPACVLFAFSPLAIYYSTEGRMYSLLWLCVLATTWASLILHQRGGGIAIYMLWIAGSAAGFLTHYFFVFPWLAILLYLLIRPGRLARRRLAACVILTSLLILPWYLKLPESLATWRISQGWLRLQPAGFDRWGASLGLITQPFSWQHVHQPSLIGYRLLLWRLVKHQWLIQHVHQPWIGYRVSYICALILFGFVGVAMVWRLRFHICGRGKLLLWLIFGAASAAPCAVDFVQHTYMVARERYALAALPVAYIFAAVGLACFRRRTRLLMLVLILVAWLPSVLAIYRNRLPWFPMREIARAVSANSRPTDLILVHSIPSGVIDVARYSNDSAELVSWIGQLRTRRVPESIRKLAAGRARIVFVKVHDSREPAPEEDWLRSNAVVSEEMRMGSAYVVKFRPINSETF